MPDFDEQINLQEAQALVDNDKAAEAVPIYEQTLADLEMKYGEEGLELADCLLGLGLAYEAVGRLSDSLRTFTRGLRLGKQLLGGTDPVVVDILVKLIDINEALGRPADALTYSEQALEAAKDCLREDDPLYIQIVDRYHHFANLAGKRDKALPPGLAGKQSDQDATPKARSGVRRPAARAADLDQGPEADEKEEETQAGKKKDSSKAKREPAQPIKATRGRALPEADSKSVTAIRFVREFGMPAIAIITVLGLIGFFVSHPPAIDKNLLTPKSTAIDRLYRTADDSKRLLLTSKGTALLISGQLGLQVPYVMAGNDVNAVAMALVASVTEKQLWADQRESTLKTEDNTIYYAADGPEAKVLAKMARLAGNARACWLRTGEFPREVSGDMTGIYSFQNPLTGADMPVQIKAMINSADSQTDIQGNLEAGGSMSDEPPSTPFKITCYSIEQTVSEPTGKHLKAVKFFVRGCDRNGNFLAGAPPKNALVIIPSDAYLNATEPLATPTTKASKHGSANSGTATAKGAKGVTRSNSKPATGAKGTAATAKADGEEKDTPDSPDDQADNQTKTPSTAAFAQEIERSVQKDLPLKPTRLWVMANPPCGVIYLHYGLPLIFFGLTLVAFGWSRMTGSDMKGRETAKQSDLAFVLAMVFMALSVFALAAEIVIFS